MGQNFNDFEVEWQGNTEDTTKLILKRLLVGRIKGNKPCVVVVTGASGEGKSYSIIAIIKILLELSGLDIKDYLDDIIIFTPLEYVHKTDRLLHDPKLKKVYMLQIDEARNVVGSDKWFSFINKTIGHINAMSRGVKRLMFFIVTQSIKDIDASTRRSVNFHFKCVRNIGHKAKIIPYVFWEDDRDIDNIKLRKRKVWGTIIKGDERYRVWLKINVTKPDDEITDRYELLQKNAKTKIIQQGLQNLVDKIERDVNKTNYSRVDELVDYFTNPKNMVELTNNARVIRGRWRSAKDFGRRYNLSREQVKEFESRIAEFKRSDEDAV